MNDDTFTAALSTMKQQWCGAGRTADCIETADLHDCLDETTIPPAFAEHLRDCGHCRIQLERLRSRQWLWRTALNNNPDAALARAFGEEGMRRLEKMESGGFVSKIVDSLINFATPLWQPEYAGEAVTAADLVEQHNRYESSDGEYVEMSCQWQDEEECLLTLQWQANLEQQSRLWARFVSPNGETILSEVLLGTELAGNLQLTGEELQFHPARRQWALSIIVEDMIEKPR